MGILKMATADYQDLNLVTRIGTVVCSSDTARTGSYSYKYNSDGVLRINHMNVTTALYYRFAFYFTTGTLYCYIGNGSGDQIEIRFGIDGMIQLKRGPTTTKTGAFDPTGGWYCAEIYALVNNSGFCTIKIDGNESLDYTGDTSYSSNAQSYIGWGVSNGSAYIDDIIIRDDQWPGRGGIYVLVPNAGSTTEEWTASSGNPEDCVDEQPPDITDYIYTNTSVHGTKQLFGIESLPAAPDEINGVGVISSAILDTPGTSYCMSIINSGGTKSSGNYLGLTTSSGIIYGYWDVNPADSLAWENADIDALEIGIETVTGV